MLSAALGRVPCRTSRVARRVVFVRHRPPTRDTVTARPIQQQPLARACAKSTGSCEASRARLPAPELAAHNLETYGASRHSALLFLEGACFASCTEHNWLARRHVTPRAPAARGDMDQRHCWAASATRLTAWVALVRGPDAGTRVRWWPRSWSPRLSRRAYCVPGVSCWSFRAKRGESVQRLRTVDRLGAVAAGLGAGEQVKQQIEPISSPGGQRPPQTDPSACQPQRSLGAAQ
jgi:hypothetical protein